MKIINRKDQGGNNKVVLFSCSVIEPNYLGTYHTQRLLLCHKDKFDVVQRDLLRSATREIKSTAGAIAV